jgi:hypothetical protein
MGGLLNSIQRTVSAILGVTAGDGAIQNHAGTRVGAALWDVYELVRDLDPRWIGVQYDIRHATAEGGQSWSLPLKLLAPWIKCTDAKDFKWEQSPGKAAIENVPASSLSNFILQAEICQRFFDNNPDRARAELNALKGAAASTFGSIKNFIFDLRPMMLDDLGVVPTLRRYVESIQEKHDLSISITVTGIERRLEEHIEVTVFRAVQELLNNAMVHGRATQLQVLLDLDQDRIMAVVEDNGSGFNVDEAIADDAKGSIGLSTLRERIEMLNGELNLQSSLGQGTRAEFSIPVENELMIG